MKEETKQMIDLSLQILRQNLIENEVSMAVDRENGRLLFFSTEEYLRNKKFDGFSVNIENLVR